MREVYTSMETEFSLVGVTGIEDRLQDEVVETLADLRTANIKVISFIYLPPYYMDYDYLNNLCLTTFALIL